MSTLGLLPSCSSSAVASSTHTWLWSVALTNSVVAYSCTRVHASIATHWQRCGCTALHWHTACWQVAPTRSHPRRRRRGGNCTLKHPRRRRVGDCCCRRQQPQRSGHAAHELRTRLPSRCARRRRISLDWARRTCCFQPPRLRGGGRCNGQSPLALELQACWRRLPTPNPTRRDSSTTATASTS